jgi:peptidoglycan/xylan/chitin deacetylase (PgdA/CDA1 family)
VSTLAVLGYHKIGPPGPSAWETWYYVPEQIFADQIGTLSACGWETIDITGLRAALAGTLRLPERAALITFDDGYRSVHEYALPVLQRLACPALLFVPTDFVGRTNEFDSDIEPVEPMCRWDQLGELSRSGVAVQSHGKTHRAFSNISPAERRQEVADSKAALEARLGGPVDFSAYPYGDDADGAGDVRAALAESGYRAAFGYGGGPFELGAADRYRLARIAMGPDTDLRAELSAVGR